MGSFIDAVAAYPTAVYTALLAVVLVYWVLALLGVVDFESSGIELDLDADAGDITSLASFVVAFGLNGVPFSVAISLLVLFSWTVSCLLGMWLMPLVPTLPLRIAAGTVGLLGSFAVALPATALTIRPLRGLFVTHNAISNAALVGRTCRVLTQSVDEKVGRAEVAQRGAGVNIRVWARTPNALSKGSSARILEYDAARACYLIEPEP